MKGIFFNSLLLLIVVIAFSSCKRKWTCQCVYSNPTTQVSYRELWGYNEKEATQVCKSDERASYIGNDIKCSVY